jgi:hypothetical protein
MPEIIVRAEPEQGDEAAVVLRERVTQRNLESDHYAGQLIERIGWAVLDASEPQDGGRRQIDRSDAGRR